MVAQLVKNLPAIWKTWVWPPGWEDLLVEGEVTPESLAGKWEAELPRRGSLLELGQDLRQASLAYIHSYSHLNWKRRALKEISLFLILCNITVSAGAGRRAGWSW